MTRLLLAGGGHSHLEVLRRLRPAPPPGTEVVLADPARYATYSGMLPGLVAGHYEFHDCHIDLEALCRSAGVAFRREAVIGLDLARSRARLAGGDALDFDLLSLDVGATPGAAGVAGAREHAIPVKPVSGLLAAWEPLLAAARHAPQRVVVVGGGAGGVELALAMRHRLAAVGPAPSRVALVAATAEVLPDHAPAARRRLARHLAASGVDLHRGSAVVAVEAAAVHLASDARLGADRVVWATSAFAPAWLAASGLATDARGFVRVDDSLRSISHPRVLAAGDCASRVSRALPKSGVYAVRQGPVLAANLARALAGAALAPYAPQRFTLALISTGGRHAVASWGPFALEGDWVWRWKDRIDRRFVAAYRAPAGPDQRRITIR